MMRADDVSEPSIPADPEVPAGGEPLLAEEPLPEASLKAVLEALLFASEEPVTPEEITTVVGADRRHEVEAALRELSEEYDSSARGLRVQPIAGGYRITTDSRLGPYVREMVRARNRQRLSRAALETLAIVAYKQPITGPEIEQIRGVNPTAILGTLLERRLVRILGRKKVVGKPFLYGTTRDFLIRFGLNSLEDLPSLEEFDAMLQEGRAANDPPSHEAVEPPAGDTPSSAPEASARDGDPQEATP